MNSHPLDTDPPAGNPPVPAGRPAPLSETQGAMNGVTVQRKLVITNPEGLHMRPVAAFAETALRFQSRVTVWKDGAGVDGKSALAMLGLAALPGTQLLLEVCGPDASAALDALMELLTSWPVAEEVRGHKAEVRDPNSETRPPDL